MATSSTTSLKLDPTLKERVRQLAAAQRRTPHWIMREAVEQYVSREEQRVQFHQDALAAWNHYQSTGLHLTAAEADAWLEQLESNPAAETPEGGFIDTR
jgi:predicted transcriptional regulator